jgi:hypothetical protein
MSVAPPRPERSESARASAARRPPVTPQKNQGRSYLAGHTYYQGTLIFSFRLAPMTSIPRLPRT